MTLFVCLFVCQQDNSSTIRDISTKLSGHHTMVQRVNKFKNKWLYRGNCYFCHCHNPTSPSRLQWTHTCKLCRVWSGRTSGSIYIGVHGWWETSLMFCSSFIHCVIDRSSSLNVCNSWRPFRYALSPWVSVLCIFAVLRNLILSNPLSSTPCCHPITAFRLPEYHLGLPTAIPAWRTCRVWEPPPSLLM